MEKLYDMIFKRKSFRRFNETLSISEEELYKINEKIKKLIPLVEGIEIKWKIVPREETTSKRGEYCLLIYSEKKENYLLNIGYMFEQLDLYVASINIGACWYGMGKVNDSQYNGLDFVIIIALGKAKESEFRKDYKKSRRKKTSEIWKGDLSFKIGDFAKYAPSSCNTQPWRIVCDSNILKIYRTNQVKSIMPKEKIPYYNSIDMGIFLYIIELVLSYNNISYQRILDDTNNQDLICIATYKLNIKKTKAYKIQ